MGTRNLVAVQKGGEYKIAQYGQWDGDPSGEGTKVLEFLRGEGNIESLRSAVDRCRFLDTGGRDRELAESYDKNINAAGGDGRTEDQILWFDRFISRDVGAEILGTVARSEGECLLQDSLSFAGESLFCEWAYVIDFDEGTFEVFEGYNKVPVTEGRFVSGDPDLVQDSRGKYHPVVLVKSYRLDGLPTGEQFLIDTRDPDCEEESDGIADAFKSDEET